MDYRNQRILITPLNWGLGHATRCIPLIIRFLNQQNKIAIASDGLALKFLKNEFPDLSYFELPSYQITYPTKLATFNAIWILPKMLNAIRREKIEIRQIAKQWNPDLIISDHRYGCFHSDIPSIFIAHQIQIISSLKITQSILRRINYHFINQFDECWVPDFEFQRLAGELSGIKGLKKAKYIGPLSRFDKLDRPRKWDLMVILSGPEPARRHLEEILLGILSHWQNKNILFVRGTNRPLDDTKVAAHIEIRDIMQSRQMNEALASSERLICRSGYSTIMDLARLGNKAILIPTPGQTEQEYLARHITSDQFIIARQDIESIQEKLSIEFGIN